MARCPHLGGGSFRVHRKMDTPASASACRRRMFWLNPASHPTSNTSSMLSDPIHLARREMARCCRQALIGGPNDRWLSSQACSRGELLVKQSAARSRNGVVGKSGSTIPTRPSTSARLPAPIRRYRRVSAATFTKGKRIPSVCTVCLPCWHTVASRTGWLAELEPAQGRNLPPRGVPD